MKNKSVHIAHAFFLALNKKSKKATIIDYGLPNANIFKSKRLLLVSLKLASFIKQRVSSRRVGVVLPPGIGAIIVNMAIFFSGKIPVNLNFSLGNKVARSLIRKAEISTIITAHKMIEKFPEFPWTKDIFDISLWLKNLAKNPHRLLLKGIFLLLPPSISSYCLGIPRSVLHDEATLLFTSGSSGEPKGVVLTHENLLSNCEQINRLGLFDKDSIILANLPLFHSFGFTVATCFPLLYGISIVTVPSPLDVKLGLKAIREEEITVLLGTPTFLRGFLARSEKEDFNSLKYIVAGAEKSPLEFIRQWEKKANCKYLEGYGLTETSPGISFNLPGAGSRQNSVGRLFDYVECKTIHPDTRVDLSMGNTGLLCFRGPNIFRGYLNDIEKTREVLTDDGWFITGDIGYIDDDGFLFIKGRASRFSKIGGEMVPHITIEDEIRKIVQFDSTESNGLVILGKPDQKKGEQLILVVEQEIDFQDLKNRLKDNGLPNLWIPKSVEIIKEIPCLPTGKIDFVNLKKQLKW